MLKKIFVYIIFFSLHLYSTVMVAQILPDSIQVQLKAGIHGFKDRYQSPSIVVAVVHENEIVFSESLGFTDLENAIPATIDSKYPILSLTKVFTATMLMQLVQEKKIALTDDIKKYLPEYSRARRNRTGVSFLQLATHTSGLPRNSPADLLFAKQVDQWILIGTNLNNLEPSSKPEFLKSLQYISKEYPEYEFLNYQDRHYSNLGYSMLGISLERAAGKDYANYIVNKICKPLNMMNSGMGTESKGTNILAKGYKFDDSSKTFLKTPVFQSNSALYAGGMYSTARDLARFISFQFDTSTSGTHILSPENRRMMQSFRIGWKPSFPLVLHEGAMLGYRCQMAFIPGLKIGWIVLTNTTDFEFSKINEYFTRLLVPVYTPKVSNDLSKYAGRYRLQGGYDSLTIYLKEGNLYSTYLQKDIPDHLLTPSGKNRFKGVGKGNYHIGYEFISNEELQIKALNLGQLMWVKE